MNMKRFAGRAAIEPRKDAPEIAPYAPHSRRCTKAGFEAQGWRAAFGDE